MKLSGNLTDDNFDELKVAVEKAKEIVKTYSEHKKGMIPVLFDLTDFTGTYNVGAMLAMKDMSDHNRPFTKKTAVYGGNDLARVAAELTIALIGDPTIKMFKAHDEALTWLLK